MNAPQPKLPLTQAQGLPDEMLVQRILQGDTPLFELVMRRHNQRIYRAARAILKDDAEAEDVMQEAYVQAYCHLAQFSGQAKLSTWLTRIAVHEAFARLRRMRRLSDLALVSPQEPSQMPTPPTPEQQAFSQELTAMLEAALERLPASARAAFVLRDVEGLSTLEAAECLDISEDALKTRLSRARALLREELLARAGAAAADAFVFHAPRCDRVVAAVLQRISHLPRP